MSGQRRPNLRRKPPGLSGYTPAGAVSAGASARTAPAPADPRRREAGAAAAGASAAAGPAARRRGCASRRGAADALAAACSAAWPVAGGAVPRLPRSPTLAGAHRLAGAGPDNRQAPGRGAHRDGAWRTAGRPGASAPRSEAAASAPPLMCGRGGEAYHPGHDGAAAQPAAGGRWVDAGGEGVPAQGQPAGAGHGSGLRYYALLLPPAGSWRLGRHPEGNGSEDLNRRLTLSREDGRLASAPPARHASSSPSKGPGTGEVIAPPATLPLAN